MSFDTFMMAYGEANAAENWARLQAIVPEARLVENVRGLFEAHAACDRLARTPWFFVVDADNWIYDGFGFEVHFEPGESEVATWAAVNPINGLYYGHGGIKLFPTGLIAAAVGRDLGPDFCTTIAKSNRWVDVRASEHRFNCDPYSTWSTAFREAAKLALGTTLGGFKKRAQARARLEAWCTRGAEAKFGAWCILGALEGRGFGLKYCRDPGALEHVNDYDWMRKTFERKHGETARAGLAPKIE
jgi:hypothetical protein